MTESVVIEPRDPLIVRDGRPFGATSGQRMKSLSWPTPTVVHGSLRTLLGKAAGGDFDNVTFVDGLKQITLAGPLPFVDGSLFLPRPLDCVVDDGSHAWAARPLALCAGEGTDQASGIPLSPVALPDAAGDFKPAKQPPFWSVSQLADWLADPSGENFQPSPDDDWGTEFLKPLPEDCRTHLQVDPATFAAEQGNLFSTTGLDFTRGTELSGELSTRLIVRVDACPPTFAPALQSLNQLHSLGGERRLAHWRWCESRDVWSCPPRIEDAFRVAGSRGGTVCMRMVLATPAYFSTGWYPDWLTQPTKDDHLQGVIPGTTVTLKLIGAVVDRWRPLSGWCYDRTGKKRGIDLPGPKPIRRLVPAGSVYFFEAAATEIAALLASSSGIAPLWLKTVCTDAASKRDGLGLAAWGVWNEHPT